MDVRDTPITDSDIQCFNVTSTLREILMDCPDSLRDSDNLVSTDDEDDDDDDDDDGESIEPKSSSAGDTSMDVSNGSDAENHKHMPDISDSESDSNDDSECSTDSEDGQDGGGGGSGGGGGGNGGVEDGSAKASGSNEDAGAPQAHCIQVILQNGRMINVNAERSNDPENAMRGPNSLRCVIGIINGRGWNYFFYYKFIK